jgi:hypothetical protein
LSDRRSSVGVVAFALTPATANKEARARILSHTASMNGEVDLTHASTTTSAEKIYTATRE